MGGGTAATLTGLTRMMGTVLGLADGALSLVARSCGGAALEAIALDWLFLQSLLLRSDTQGRTDFRQPLSRPKNTMGGDNTCKMCADDCKATCLGFWNDLDTGAATRSASSRTAAPTRASSATRAAAPAC